MTLRVSMPVPSTGSDIGYLRVNQSPFSHYNSIRLTEMNKNRENKVNPTQTQIDLLTTFIRLAGSHY